MSGRAPPAVQQRADRVLVELSVRHGEWSNATLQDAVESMRRLGRWHLIRRGCRVPVHDLYYVSMRRQAELLARRFVDEAAGPTAAALGVSEAELILAGKGCIEPESLGPGQVDRVLAQRTFEPTVDFLRRFQTELTEHLDALYDQHIRRWLLDTLQRVATTWSALG